MHIKSIEDTPNYNTIKINLSEKRKDNQSNTYTSGQDGQPDFVIRLFDIEGAKSVFYVIDFISVDTEEYANWDDLVPKIEDTF